MSTRWYPIYQRGNPQLRIFLPNFWLKLIKPKYNQPENIVEFSCSMHMTKLDIRNYLEKIYGIPVVHIRTRIAMGQFRRAYGAKYIIQDEDVKHAYVLLPKNEKFVFPDIFPTTEEEKLEKDKKDVENAKVEFHKYIDKNRDRHGVPPWYTF